MTDLEKAIAVMFFICGLFVGGLGGLAYGPQLTYEECVTERLCNND